MSIIKKLGILGKKLFDKNITISGVPKELNFQLIGMYNHLRNGGIVTITFNSDGTIFTAKREEKTTLNKREILFAHIKSDVSACICRAICEVDGSISSENLNLISNIYTDRIITTIRNEGKNGQTNNSSIK